MKAGHMKAPTGAALAVVLLLGAVSGCTQPCPDDYVQAGDCGEEDD